MFSFVLSIGDKLNKDKAMLRETAAVKISRDVLTFYELMSIRGWAYRGPATINDQCLARNVFCFVRYKEERRVGNVFNGCRPSKGCYS